MTLGGIAPDGLFHIDFPADWLGPDVLSLLMQERHEFEAVLGVPVVFSEPAGACCRWVVERADPGEVSSLTWNADRGVLVSRAADGQGVMATLSLLQTLAHSPGTQVFAAPPATVDEAVELIRTECASSYPYFTLRGLRWDDICAVVLQDRPRTWDQFIPWATRWVAQLGDAHTAVIDHRAAEFHPPYTAELLECGAVMIRVPEKSAACAAGVRPGWIIDVGDPAAWWTAVGASPQQHGRMAARRAMAFKGHQRRFTARDPHSSRSVTWIEEACRPSRDDIVTLERTRAGEVHIVLRAFEPSVGVESVFDGAAAVATPSDHMVLDLRGNVGGDIMLAGRLRDRFLRARTCVGSVSFTDGRGGLSEPQPRWADPSDSGRWPGTLTVVADASTYSAAEDFLVGLKGLEHVTVVGERTGGGSGRPRLLPLGPGCSLRISTALTYDRRGRPVEFHGIEPDEEPC